MGWMQSIDGLTQTLRLKHVRCIGWLWWSQEKFMYSIRITCIDLFAWEAKKNCYICWYANCELRYAQWSSAKLSKRRHKISSNHVFNSCTSFLIDTISWYSVFRPCSLSVSFSAHCICCSDVIIWLIEPLRGSSSLSDSSFWAKRSTKSLGVPPVNESYSVFTRRASLDQ